MYQSNYYQNLGTAGHRATNSFNYVPQPTSNYYPYPHPPPPHPHHHHSRSMYSYQPVGTFSYVPPQAPIMPQPMMAPVLPPVEDTTVNGGINLVLEYDLNSMSTFISWCTFGMFKQNKNPSKEFEKLVCSVLFATRLPKSTIIIALEYMNQRFSNKSFDDLLELELFVKLTIALILANKFNDDNTFTNRSWCGATGLKIELINKEERAWLQECNWQLNVVNFKTNIQTLEECWVAWVDKFGKTNPPPVTAQAATSSPASNYYNLYSSQGYYSNNSIPSSPNYYSNSSPLNSSPIRYQDSIWLDRQYQPAQPLLVNHQSNIWSYTPTYQYLPPNSCNDYNPNGFVSYANPYYEHNLTSY